MLVRRIVPCLDIKEGRVVKGVRFVDLIDAGDPVELAEEQVKIATGQRVLGIIPDFYTSYDWNAPPMRAKQ